MSLSKRSLHGLLFLQGGFMSLEKFKEFSEDLAAQFTLKVDFIHETIASLYVGEALQKVEIARVFYSVDENPEIYQFSISFQIEAIPSDMIRIFNYAGIKFPQLQLLTSFFALPDGQFYSGLDAQIMMEQVREAKYFDMFMKREKQRELEEWQIKQQEKKKPTFH